jgi:hypothetical protein
MRYYLSHSHIFDNPDNKYDFSLFEQVILEAGGTGVTTEHAFGWSNQPKVIVFEANGDTHATLIGNALSKVAPWMNHPLAHPLVRRMDWFRIRIILENLDDEWNSCEERIVGGDWIASETEGRVAIERLCNRFTSE